MERVVRRALERRDEESGAVVVLFALVLIVLFAAVAFAIDLSRLFHERQVLQNAVDFGALAGAQELPAQGAAQGSVARAEALKVTLDNAPDLDPAGINISFRCTVGDRDGDGQPDLADARYACGPSSGTWSTGWRIQRNRAQHDCDPNAGDKCNALVVRTSTTVNYVFAPVIGIRTGNTGSVAAVACRGACGAEPNPLDVVIVLDRTWSMVIDGSPALDNAKEAALSVLDFYDSTQQHVGVAALPYGPTGCPPPSGDGGPGGVTLPQLYPQGAASLWQVSPLSSDYDRADGTLNTSSQIVRYISCLKSRPASSNPSADVKVNGVNRGPLHTNLGDPVDAAREMLATQGRPEVRDVIIFLTDGVANQPDGLLPCNYFNNKATIAKNADQEIFTIAYGVGSERCAADNSGPFLNAFATTNIAAAATDSVDDVPGGCGPNENKDGDHYFCQAGTGDLEVVFRQIAIASLGHSRLVQHI